MTSAKLGNLAVTNAKIGDLQVTGGKVANNTLGAAQINEADLNYASPMQARPSP